MEEQLRQIQEYVFGKFIEGGGADPLDELEAVQFLEDYFGRPENANNSDCFYPGVMYFELGYEIEDRQVEFFRRSKYWLEKYRILTGEEEWDVIDDRLEDLDAFFEDSGIEVGELPNAEELQPEEEFDAPLTVKEVEDHGPMMLVAGGSFLFGPEQERRSLAAFYIDKFPVTNRQYEAFCRATGYRFPKYWGEKRFNNPDAPVVGISVADATKYSRWVGKELPSEEQWEKASRGVDGRVFPWGGDDAGQEHACFGQDPQEGSTAPVRESRAGVSPFGVRDLAGNVWEWTSTTDQDGETVHVIKGGCYNDPAELLATHFKLEAPPKDKFETIGFRCVKPA